MEFHWSLFSRIRNEQIYALCEKCPNTKLFWSVFSRILTKKNSIHRSFHAVTGCFRIFHPNAGVKGVFRTLSNIYERVFLREQLAALTSYLQWQKSCIIDVSHSFKYTPTSMQNTKVLHSDNVGDFFIYLTLVFSTKNAVANSITSRLVKSKPQNYLIWLLVKTLVPNIQ